MGEYTIQGGRAGKSRLDVLAEIMRPTTSSLLDAAGIAAGARCLDVGCGGGHVAVELARRAGPSGSVSGIDFDAEVLELARLDAKAQGVDHIDFHVGDARDPDGGPYDVVYARFLLSHLDRPDDTVTRFVRLLAPGGVLVAEDVYMSGSICHPPNAAFARSIEVYRATVAGRGGDGDLGLRLPRMLHDAGLADVQARVAHPLGLQGTVKQIWPLTIARMAESIIGLGVAGPDEVERLVSELDAMAADPGTLMGMPPVIQAWARVPRPV